MVIRCETRECVRLDDRTGLHIGLEDGNKVRGCL